MIPNKQNPDLQDLLFSPGNQEDILDKIKDETMKGKLHILYTKFLDKHKLSTNMIIPYIDEYNSEIRDLVIVNNPDDVERLVNTHVKKTPHLKPLLYNSIISTTDVDLWKQQRQNYQPAFS